MNAPPCVTWTVPEALRDIDKLSSWEQRLSADFAGEIKSPPRCEAHTCEATQPRFATEAAVWPRFLSAGGRWYSSHITTWHTCFFWVLPAYLWTDFVTISGCPQTLRLSSCPAVLSLNTILNPSQRQHWARLSVLWFNNRTCTGNKAFEASGRHGVLDQMKSTVIKLSSCGTSSKSLAVCRFHFLRNWWHIFH